MDKKITEETIKYLNGEKFEINHIFKINEKFDRITRIEKILELTKGKKFYI